MFGIIGFVKMLPLALVVGGLGFVGHWFVVKNLKNKLAKEEAQVEFLLQKNTALEISTQEQQKTIESLQKSLEIQLDAISNLTLESSKWEEMSKKYIKIFSEHDLTKLARAKPGLIEIRINKATKEVFDGIEEQTTQPEG